MIGLLVRAYPGRWRARYGEEFAALLAERPLGPFDVADILLGALDAHLHLRGLGAASTYRKGFGMSLRIGGWAAISGGVLWCLALLVQSTALAFAATLTLVGAQAGLSAFGARRDPSVVWVALGVAGVGGLAALTGIGGMGQSIAGVISGWDLWAVGMIVLGLSSAMFAAAARHARSLPLPGAAVLSVCSLAAVGGMLAVATPVGPALGLSEALILPLVYVSMMAFAVGWIVVGLATVLAETRSPTRLAGSA